MSANRRILKESGHCPAGKQEGDTSLPSHWLSQGRSLERIYITAHPFTYTVSDYIPSLCAERAGARSLLKGEQIPENKSMRLDKQKALDMVRPQVQREKRLQKNGNEMMPIGPEVSKIHALN